MHHLVEHGRDDPLLRWAGVTRATLSTGEVAVVCVPALRAEPGPFGDVFHAQTDQVVGSVAQVAEDQPGPVGRVRQDSASRLLAHLAVDAPPRHPTGRRHAAHGHVDAEGVRTLAAVDAEQEVFGTVVHSL